MSVTFMNAPVEADACDLVLLPANITINGCRVIAWLGKAMNGLSRAPLLWFHSLLPPLLTSINHCDQGSLYAASQTQQYGLLMRYIPCTSNLDGFGWASSILLHHTEKLDEGASETFQGVAANSWFRRRFHCLCVPLCRSQFKRLLTRWHLQTWQVWVAQLSFLMDRQLQPGFSFASHWRKHRRSGPGLVTTCRSTSQHGNCLHSLHCPIASRLHCLGPAVPSCATKPGTTVRHMRPQPKASQ